MVVSGWNKNRHVPKGILNPFGDKINEKIYATWVSTLLHNAVRENTLNYAKTPPET